MLSGIIIQYL